MAAETHIAGLPMYMFDRYLLQRCGWCGAVLLGYDLERVAVMNKPDGSPGDAPAMFEVGRLIRFSYDGLVARWGEVGLSRTSMVVLDELDSLPDDACPKHIPFEDGRHA